VGGAYGSQIWRQESIIPGFNNVEFANYSMCVLSVYTVAGNLWTVYKKKPSNFLRALNNLITFCYLMFSLALVGHLSPSNVIDRKLRFLVYLVGFSFAKLVGILQVSHVAKIDFKPERKTIWIAFTLLNLNTIIGAINGKCPVDEDSLIDYLLILTLIVYVHFVINIVNQLANILKIRVFIVKPIEVKKE